MYHVCPTVYDNAGRAASQLFSIPQNAQKTQNV